MDGIGPSKFLLLIIVGAVPLMNRKHCVLSASVHEMIHFRWYLRLWPANSACDGRLM